MIVRLNDRLKVNEEQKTEITNILFTYIKRITENGKVNKTTPEIVSSWLRYTYKPEWVEEKLNEDIEFLAGICEFVERYKRKLDIDKIEQCDIKYKM